MPGPPPKPDDQRVRRNAPTFNWTMLEPLAVVVVPELPGWRVWQTATVSWWAGLWGLPQASQWDPSGQSLWVLAALYDDLFAGRADAAKVSGEQRQHEDRHGLSPKALLALRWRLGEGEQPAGQVVAFPSSRFDGLRVTDG